MGAMTDESVGGLVGRLVWLFHYAFLSPPKGGRCWVNDDMCSLWPG